LKKKIKSYFDSKCQQRSLRGCIRDDLPDGDGYICDEDGLRCRLVATLVALVVGMND
jgi:hypothetical protein